MPETYERRDTDNRTLTLFGIGLAVLTIVALLAMWLLFRAFATSEARRDVPPSPLASTRQPTPEPRLQVAPAQDMAQLRAREDAQLNHYSWIDKETGTVRIPIERAMELIARRGLPARTPQPEGDRP